MDNLYANLGICLAPGFLNDHNPEFAWTPFDCKETISCVLCTHKGNTHEAVNELVKLMQNQYKLS